MSSRSVAAESPRARTAAAREPGGDGATAQDRFSIGAHLVAIAVVLLLFGNLLGPLGSSVVLMGAAGVVGIAILRSLARHGAVAWRTVLLALLIALVVAIRAFYDPPMTTYGQTKWVNFTTTTLATMAAAAAVSRPRVIRAMAVWWVVVGMALAVLALAGPAAATGRAQVEGSNPVWLGRATSASIVIAVWMGASSTWRWWRVVVVVPILAVGLLATGSRGPAAAAIIGVTVLLLAPTARRSRQSLWLVLLGAGGLAIAPTVPAVANSRFGRFIADGDVGSETRGSLWTESLRAIPDLPFGAGIGDWSQATGITRHAWPHNVFLEVFVEQGWLAGVLLVVLVIIIARRLWRRAGDDPGLQLALALLVTETVHVSTSGDLNARTFFFVLLLAVTLLNKRRFEAQGQGLPTGDLSPSGRAATLP